MTQELIDALVLRGCGFLTAALNEIGCTPIAENINVAVGTCVETPNGPRSYEHVVSCPIPAQGEPLAFKSLATRHDDVEGSPLEEITDERLKKASRSMALLIFNETKNPVFGNLYVPKAVESRSQQTNNSVTLRLVRAFDIITLMFITRLDCVYRDA